MLNSQTKVRIINSNQTVYVAEDVMTTQLVRLDGSSLTIVSSYYEPIIDNASKVAYSFFGHANISVSYADGQCTIKELQCE